MTTKKTEHLGVYFFLSLALVLPFAAWYGFVIKTLWSWFVVPFGVVPIGVWEAAGLYLLIRLLTLDTTLPREDERSPAEKLGAAVAIGVLAPATGLAFGAIYHAFA